MTKSEFSKQTWNYGDSVELASNETFKVQSVGFFSCSIQIRRDGVSSWLRCEEIVAHFDKNDNDVTYLFELEEGANREMKERINQLEQQLRDEKQKRMSPKIQHAIDSAMTVVGNSTGLCTSVNRMLEKLENACDLLNLYKEEIQK